MKPYTVTILPTPAPPLVLKELEARLHKYANDYDVWWMHEAAHQMAQLRARLKVIEASREQEGGAK